MTGLPRRAWSPGETTRTLLCAASMLALAAGPGGASAQGVPAEPPPALSPSTLPLTLTGLAVDAARPAMSRCFIRCGVPGQRQGTFVLAPGDLACDLAEIRDVREDAVVIRNLLTNRLELLSFPGASAPPVDKHLTAAPPFAPHAVAESPNLITVTLDKSSVDRYLVNLGDILASALATPHYRATDNGQRVMDGFELDRIKAGSVVEQLGLRDGDVIAVVNGDVLDSMAAVMKLVGQAQDLTRVRMTVLRNGQPLTFDFNLTSGIRQ